VVVVVVGVEDNCCGYGIKTRKRFSSLGCVLPSRLVRRDESVLRVVLAVVLWEAKERAQGRVVVVVVVVMVVMEGSEQRETRGCVVVVDGYTYTRPRSTVSPALYFYALTHAHSDAGRGVSLYLVRVG
jgi:hypothetical protein